MGKKGQENMNVKHPLPKVLVAVPCMGTIPVETVRCLMALQHSGAVVFQSQSVIYEAREEIAKSAIEEGFDYILWLDSDMIFEPNVLGKLMACKKDVVSGVYFKRVFPYTPVIYTPKKDKLEVYEDYPTHSGIFEIGACGFGCVLTKVSVIKAVMDKYGGAFFPIGGTISEDISFCMRARNLGYKIFCEPSVSCGHISQMTVTKEYYEQMRKAVKHAEEQSKRNDK